MIDFYNKNNFNSISINGLTELFKNNNTIRKGAISIFGDSIGKPGDISYCLNYIKTRENVIEFGINYGKILIYYPFFIVSNEKMICIGDSTRIEWIDENTHLIYNKVDNIVKTEVIIGKHSFRTKNDEDALLFYTW